MKQALTRTLYILVLIVLVIIAYRLGLDKDGLAFRPITANSIASLLTPLFVIALFLERALEVFITTWRDQTRSVLELKTKSQATEDSEELVRYRTKTEQIAFIAGVSAGVLISVAGIRVLAPLLNPAAAPSELFNFVDIFLTAGLLAGGADGIHKLMSVILDFLDQTRERIEPSN